MSSSRGQRASSADEEERTASRMRHSVARCSGRSARRFPGDFWPPPEGVCGGLFPFPPCYVYGRSSGRSSAGSGAQQDPQAGGIIVKCRRPRRADSISRRGMILWDARCAFRHLPVVLCIRRLKCIRKREDISELRGYCWHP